MRTKALWLGSAIVLGAAVLQAAEEPSILQRRHVTVQGQGKLQAVPDIARITVEVSQDGAALDPATAQVRRQMTAVLQALKKNNIAEKDIQTQAYQVEPKLAWNNGNSKRVGFHVVDRISVKVRDLNGLGKVLSDVTAAGATSVEGPNFDFDNPKELERKVLALATEDAAAKARVLAEAAHASLGPALAIEQLGGFAPSIPPRPMFAMKSMATHGAAPEPIQTGEQDFVTTITATFALQ